MRVLICYDNAIGKIPLLLYVLNADELVGDGVDDEAGGAVYLQLLRYVAAVGGHGVHREAEGVGNLFVAQPFGDTDEDVFLAVAQEVRPVAGVLTVSCHAEHREASRNVPWQSPCARSFVSLRRCGHSSRCSSMPPRSTAAPCRGLPAPWHCTATASSPSSPY